MSLSFPSLNIEQLSTAQRLDLSGLLWDSIPDSVEALPVPEWHREEIERRLAAADARPEAAVPWNQVKARMREQG